MNTSDGTAGAELLFIFRPGTAVLEEEPYLSRGQLHRPQIALGLAMIVHGSSRRAKKSDPLILSVYRTDRLHPNALVPACSHLHGKPTDARRHIS